MTTISLEVDRFTLNPYLSCKAATQVHGTGASLGCLEPQHDGGGEFIVSSTTAGLLLLAQTHTKSTGSTIQTKTAKFYNMSPSISVS